MSGAGATGRNRIADLQPRLAQFALFLSEALAHVPDYDRSSPGREPLDRR